MAALTSSFSFYTNLDDNVIKLFTRNIRKNMMINSTIKGEKSIPPNPNGSDLRARYSTGSVTLWINRTMGL
jgi:hypothetical protein